MALHKYIMPLDHNRNLRLSVIKDDEDIEINTVIEKDQPTRV